MWSLWRRTEPVVVAVQADSFKTFGERALRMNGVLGISFHLELNFCYNVCTVANMTRLLITKHFMLVVDHQPVKC